MNIDDLSEHLTIFNVFDKDIVRWNTHHHCLLVVEKEHDRLTSSGHSTFILLLCLAEVCPFTQSALQPGRVFKSTFFRVRVKSSIMRRSSGLSKGFRASPLACSLVLRNLLSSGSSPNQVSHQGINFCSFPSSAVVRGYWAHPLHQNLIQGPVEEAKPCTLERYAILPIPSLLKG